MELLRAIRKNSNEKVKKILKNGCNPNTLVKEFNSSMRIYYNTIPLCVAAANGYVQVAQSLIEYGADVNAYNNAWSSPLHLATYCGYESMIQMLIKKNANLNIQDSRGNTALHEACRGSRVSCVTLLLKHNIDLNIRNNDLKTALDLAEKNKCTIIINLIKRKLIKQNVCTGIHNRKTTKKDKVVRFQEEVIFIPTIWEDS